MSNRVLPFSLLTIALLALAVALAGPGALSTLPTAGSAGAPFLNLTEPEAERFLRGRERFVQPFHPSSGLGPRFNGDSCATCHGDPVTGGAGGRDLQIHRFEWLDAVGEGGLAHTHSTPGTSRSEVPLGTRVERRNSPTLLGLGLIERIPEDVIFANADPDDRDSDGIRGIVHELPDGRVGRLGWKADTADLESFLRSAFANELGITVPDDGSETGLIADDDDAADPELDAAALADVVFFVRALDFAPRGEITEEVARGEAAFHATSCARCHVPSLPAPGGEVHAYTNVLLHHVLPPDFVGVTQGEAGPGLYRTPSLRGVAQTAPYFHDGQSETLDEAIRRHDGEARAAREAYERLSEDERAALLAFLRSL